MISVFVFLALGWSLLFKCANANVCIAADMVPHTTQGNPVPWFTIHNQTELDALKDCETIIGGIVIAGNYTGPAKLSGVKNITDGIEMGQDWTSVTEILLDDLQYLGALNILTPWAPVTSVIFPDAIWIGSIYIPYCNNTILDFPSLQNSSSIRLTGNITSMNFPKLIGVDEELLVCSIAAGEDCTSYDAQGIKGYPPLAIDFPALVNASNIVLGGNVSSINMPSLEIAPEGVETGRSLFINAFQIPIDVSFPKLRQSDYSEIDGYISSISLPSLRFTSELYIQASENLVVNLSSLVSASILSFTGNITSADFANLTHINTLSIVSKDKNVDCSGAKAAYTRSTDPEAKTSGYTCTGPYVKPKGPMSDQTKVGIGVGSAMGGLFLAAATLWTCAVYADKKLKRKRAADIELRTRNAEGGYNSEGGTDVASVRSEHTIVVDEDRERYQRLREIATQGRSRSNANSGLGGGSARASATPSPNIFRSSLRSSLRGSRRASETPSHNTFRVDEGRDSAGERPPGYVAGVGDGGVLSRESTAATVTNVGDGREGGLTPPYEDFGRLTESTVDLSEGTTGSRTPIVEEATAVARPQSEIPRVVVVGTGESQGSSRT